MREWTRRRAGVWAATALVSAISFFIVEALIGAVHGANPASESGAAYGGSASSPEAAPDKASTPFATGSVDKTELLRASWTEVNGWNRIVHVCLQSEVSSKTSHPGDIVWGLLDDDCKWGSKIIAERDSFIRGHIVSISRPRTIVNAAMSSERRWRTEADITIQFDQVIDHDGNSWPICGRICRSNDLSNTTPGVNRTLEVDSNGRIFRAGPAFSETEETALLAARMATAFPYPGSWVLNFAIMPAAMGLAGAAYPSFAYNRPVDMSEKHVRQKAFAYGFVTNLPGVAAVQACVQKGTNTDLRAGDQLVVDMKFQQNPYCVSDVSVLPR